MLLTAFSILMLLVSCSPQNPGVSKPASCEDDQRLVCGLRCLAAVYLGWFEQQPFD